MQPMILAILFQSALLTAQVGTPGIQGTVTDAAGNMAVAGAFVTAIRSGLPLASQTAASASGWPVILPQSRLRLQSFG
jgi:hypothetical protein